MKTKQEKIDAIYEKVANKELSIGCKIKVKRYFAKYDFTSNKNFLINGIVEINGDGIMGGYRYVRKVGVGIMYGELGHTIFNIQGESRKKMIPKKDNSNEGIDFIEEIIGHPVMIGDVLEWVKKNREYKMIGLIEDFVNMWKYKRLTIEEQSEECIDYVYNLIK